MLLGLKSRARARAHPLCAAILPGPSEDGVVAIII